MLYSQESPDDEGRGPWDLRVIAAPCPLTSGKSSRRNMCELSRSTEQPGEPWARGETSRKNLAKRRVWQPISRST